jgi:hypothetical protein
MAVRERRAWPPVGGIVVWLLIPPVVSLVIWLVWFFGAMAVNGGEWRANHDFWILLQRWLWPGGFDPLHGTTVGMLVTIAWLLLGCVFVSLDEDYEADEPRRIPLTVLIVLMLFCSVQAVRGINDNAKDAGRGYAGTARNPATIFLVRDPGAAPSFIADLTGHADRVGSGPCVLVGRHDVPGCVAQGDLPTDWERRVVSISSARYQMRTNSPSAGNTDLRENSVSYLYRTAADGTAEVRVSGVRDGKNNKPLHSVVEWDGRGNPTACAFEGRYALDKAFNGKWSRNLRDLIAEEQPSFQYDDEDIWGYCDGDEPKVVIPGTRQVAFGQRTVLRPAGVLIITGRDGRTRIERRAKVGPGDLPGPAYPLTLVQKQRELSSWAAGERFHNRGGFGFDLTGATTQLGNNGVFQLRSKGDGRRYWVSPLVSRESDSEQLIAYGITPADSVTSGALNTERIYVLNDGDARITAIPRMENRIKTFLSADPGFYPAGGHIVEFLPLDGVTWQAYGELNGQVKYLFTVPVDESKPISVVNLSTGAPYTPPQPGDVGGRSPCADFRTATREQLRDCALQALEEDKRRGENPSAAPSGAPSVPASPGR